MDIDAGPILFGLSPSGTAFFTGSATYFEDTMARNKILRTAELAGSTIKIGDKRHYLLADIALVGEAIMLAMRTNVKIISQQILYWYGIFNMLFVSNKHNRKQLLFQLLIVPL